MLTTRQAVAAAAEVLGPNYNIDQLTDLSLAGFKLGKFAASVGQSVQLASFVLKELAFITDALLGGFGADNDTQILLSLLRRRAQVPMPATTGASCADSAVFDVARLKIIDDPTATADAVDYCDGQWAVVSVSSETDAPDQGKP